jgi:hypothetical protein
MRFTDRRDDPVGPNQPALARPGAQCAGNDSAWIEEPALTEPQPGPWPCGRSVEITHYVEVNGGVPQTVYPVMKPLTIPKQRVRESPTHPWATEIAQGLALSTA